MNRLGLVVIATVALVAFAMCTAFLLGASVSSEGYYGTRDCRADGLSGGCAADDVDLVGLGEGKGRRKGEEREMHKAGGAGISHGELFCSGWIQVAIHWN